MNGKVSARILSTGRSVGDARIHRLANALHDASVQISVEGLGEKLHGPQAGSVQTRPSPGPLIRLLRAFWFPFRGEEDVLVVVDPELFLPAYLATRIRRIPLVCDVYEDYVKVAADRSWAQGKVRNACVRLAARAFVASAGWAELTLVADDHVPPHSAKHRFVVQNRAMLEPVNFVPDPALRQAAYVGDVRCSRGALVMIEALRESPEWTLDIVGPVAGVDADQIYDAARGCERIRFHGRQAPSESWKLVARASVGLSLLDSTPAYVDAFPSKVYEYAAAGMAVISSSLPRPAQVVEGHKIGAVGSTAEEVAMILAAWAEDPESLRDCQQRALNWSHESSREGHPATTAARKIFGLVSG